MKYSFNIILAILYCNTNLFSQNITGQLSLLTNQEISLQGFKGLKNYIISQTRTDSSGKFTLNYSKNDYGMVYLMSTDNKPLFLISSGEDIDIIGESLSNSETIKITKGQENQWLEKYGKEHPLRENSLSAWVFLEKLYLKNDLFKVQKKALKAIDSEKKRILIEDETFITQLPDKSYIKWFIPIRKMISSVPTVAQYRTEEIPATIKALRNLDFTDNRFYKSGLYKDALESHFWLMENSGKPLDSAYIDMQISIDILLKNLINDEQKLNEVTDFLFTLLEQHSLFTASEYLATKVLNEKSCTINSDLTKHLETYRAMKKGNIAKDFVFPKSTFNNPNENNYKKLSDLKSKYTLVVFGASWCPKCKEEIPQISNYYHDWSKKGIEVIFVSLDDNEIEFSNFVSTFPFISICDYQKWNSSIVQDYYIFGTPSMYLLDNNQKIILRPNSVVQVASWVETYINNGN